MTPKQKKKIKVTHKGKVFINQKPEKQVFETKATNSMPQSECLTMYQLVR